LSSFEEAAAWGENPRLKKGAKYYTGNISWFDTGGYTGTWGPEGRMAMLHQKEIVLNAHDTENFLTAVEIVRTMSNQLEANAKLAQMGLGALNSSFNMPITGDTLQ
jgi:hypothetical protein